MRSTKGLQHIRIALGTAGLTAYAYSQLWPFALIGSILIVTAFFKVNYGVGECDRYQAHLKNQKSDEKNK